MAENGGSAIHRFPQSKAVDCVRWLPAISAFDRFVAAAVHDPDAGSSSLEVHALESIHQADESTVPDLIPRDSWPSSSRISSLRSSAASAEPSTVAVSTFSGSVHFLFVDPVEGAVESELSARGLHGGVVSAVDLQVDGRDCVSVGEDGRVNLVSVGEGGLERRGVHDARGLVSYTAVRWGSSVEFATGGLGFGVQWWDQRKPGGPVSNLKGDWIQGIPSGIVHSIDVHPSRKHICLAGGSSGVVFAWDLRWQQRPVLLSGADLGEPRRSPCESDVWEIQYDSTVQSGFGSAAPAKILPIMICSEDGVLAVLEQGQDPIELLAEPCAVNAFDIDRRNPSDVVCSLEWETIALLLRPRDSSLF
ncbi:transducin/WD40 repeat-like superfamily protein [Wolffia australiana]